MEKSISQSHLLLKRACLASYIWIGLVIVMVLSFIFGITRRDFWWPILGAVNNDSFGAILIIQLVLLISTWLISKKKWIGFILYIIFTISQVLIVIAGMYQAPLMAIIIILLISLIFIVLFFIHLRRIKLNS